MSSRRQPYIGPTSQSQLYGSTANSGRLSHVSLPGFSLNLLTQAGRNLNPDLADGMALFEDLHRFRSFIEGENRLDDRVNLAGIDQGGKASKLIRAGFHHESRGYLALPLGLRSVRLGSNRHESSARFQDL